MSIRTASEIHLQQQLVVTRWIAHSFIENTNSKGGVSFQAWPKELRMDRGGGERSSGLTLRGQRKSEASKTHCIICMRKFSNNSQSETKRNFNFNQQILLINRPSI